MRATSYPGLLVHLLAGGFALATVGGCTSPREVKDTLDEAEKTLVAAHAVYAPLCAPEELANAESAVDFVKVEAKQGYVLRAKEHADYGLEQARAALAKATPCGTADRDQDKIPDIVDRCPDEKEDYDGDNDTDGCRDIDPNGDEDKDGIRNIDDACVDQPEDFDGDADEDGCPETSEDSDGDGLINAVDKCVNEAEDLDGFKDSDGCPEPDNDNDTVIDIRDMCALVAEDIDQWEDEDGCPDPDNDLDGIPDTSDQCPNEAGLREQNGCPSRDKDGDGIADGNDGCIDQPETKNGYLDEDGCPDSPPSRVKVTKTMVEIKETIQFASGKAEVLSVSFPVLDDVVKVLKDVPEMKLRVEGHTDSDGSDESNLKLSQDRANSVMSYLISRGVDPTRLTAAGFGETRPIDTNRTREGKAKNRRVEFHIVKDDAPPTP